MNKNTRKDRAPDRTVTCKMVITVNMEILHYLMSSSEPKNKKGKKEIA